MIEGALWLTFPEKELMLNAALTYAYSAFRHVLWPVFVPLPVLLVEPALWRRRAITTVVAGGSLVAIYLRYTLITQPITATVEGNHIAYVSPHFHSVMVMSLYLLGTSIGALLSSHRAVRLFGAAAFASFVAAYIFYATWFISIWFCFAAVISGFILLHFIGRTSYNGSGLKRAVPGRDRLA